MLTGAVQLFNRTLSGLSPFQLVLGTIGAQLVYRAATMDWGHAKAETQRQLFYYLNQFPPTRKLIQKQIQAELGPELKKLDASVHAKRTVRFTSLPEQAVEKDDLVTQIREICNFDRLGDQISGAIYRSDEKALSEFAAKIFELSAFTNPLHPGLWDDIRQCENEVVQWCAKFMRGEGNYMGTINHGGTTSILEAVRTYREWAKTEKNITKPNIIVAKNRHVAFDKGGKYFGVDVIEVDTDPVTGQMNIDQVKKKVNKNTIMIVGSAPSYPHGIVDDIPELGKIALKRGCGLHVDACLGGFVAPFLKAAGFDDLPDFDFSVPGVTSMSIDTHKQGNVPKGSSVFVAEDEIGKYQADFFPSWQGGLYLTPGMDGSRPGSMILLTWAIMASIGRLGYVEQARKIRTLLDNLKEEISNTPELAMIGNPKVNVVAFRFVDPKYNIYLLGEQMEKLGEGIGWHLNALQDPPALHVCLTAKQTERADYVARFMADLKKAIRYVKKHPNEKPKKDGATYGALQKIPNAVAPQLLEIVGREYNACDASVEERGAKDKRKLRRR